MQQMPQFGQGEAAGDPQGPQFGTPVMVQILVRGQFLWLLSKPPPGASQSSLMPRPNGTGTGTGAHASVPGRPR